MSPDWGKCLAVGQKLSTGVNAIVTVAAKLVCWTILDRLDSLPIFCSPSTIRMLEWSWTLTRTAVGLLRFPGWRWEFCSCHILSPLLAGAHISESTSTVTYHNDGKRDERVDPRLPNCWPLGMMTVFGICHGARLRTAPDPKSLKSTNVISFVHDMN